MVTVEENGLNTVITAGNRLTRKQRFLQASQTIIKNIFSLARYRELIRNLVVRDLKVRYRSSALGILWSLFNPLLMMVVFTVVFTVMTPYSD